MNGLKQRILTALFSALLIIGAGAHSAWAQQPDTEQRLNRIENEIQTLSRALFKGDLPSQPSVVNSDTPIQADTELRLSQLESEIRSLTGQIEQQAFEIRRVREMVDRLVSDLEMRVGELEHKSVSLRAQNDSSNAAPPAEDTYDLKTFSTTEMVESVPAEDQGKITVTNLDAPPTMDMSSGQLGTLPVDKDGEVIKFEGFESDSPTVAYEQAFTLLRQKNYNVAEQAFSSFIDRYPGHALAGNAKYWLGETFYVRGDYERAAREFAEAYQKYPDGAKAPDNLLKLGMSLAGMGKKEDACLALAELKRSFSYGAKPVLIRADQEALRLGCDQ
jgi:tol-pal system protein YbgF